MSDSSKEPTLAELARRLESAPLPDEARAELARLVERCRRTEEALARRTREVDAVGHLISRARRLHSRAEVARMLLEAATKGLGFDRAAYFDIEDETGRIQGVAAEVATQARLDISQVRLDAPDPSEAIGRVISAQEAAIISASGGATGATGAAGAGGAGGYLLSALGSEAAAVVPVVTGKGVTGFVLADNAARRAPVTPDDLASLSMLVEKAGIAFENAALYEHAERFKAMAETDTLTGLNNRRSFFRLLQGEIYRAKRYKLPLSIAMLDIDKFKSLNDTHGHQAGDTLLRSLARLLKKTSRNIDVVGRIGGEEFAVILPETTLEAANIYAERVRKLAQGLGEKLVERFPGYILTLSIGLTSYNEASDDLDSFIHRGDQAMYAAKQRGRNRVCAL